MQCYFASWPDLVAFNIPSLGITLKAKYPGTDEETAYAALMAVLEFRELNPILFKGSQNLEIFGDSFLVVNQFNQQMFCPKELRPYCALARSYLNKFQFSVSLIFQAENLARVTP